MSFVFCIVLLFSSSIRTTGLSLLRIVKNKAIASNEVIRIVEVIRSVTDTKDKISVCGSNDNIYLLSDRYSVSKYSYQLPIAKINRTIKDEYLKDIALLHPKVIVLRKEIFMYDDVINAMNGEYELIETTDSFEVYLV